MKLKLCLPVVFVWLFISCASENEDDLMVDCSKGDLSILLESTTASSCNEGGSIVLRGTGGKGTLEYS
ncbi:MAG: hypothetical protein WBA74_26165, partial [Cyclobacteriaceae bacterium]